MVELITFNKITTIILNSFFSHINQQNFIIFMTQICILTWNHYNYTQPHIL
jgi:hypothetical protein